MAQFTNRATLTYGTETKTSNETVGEIISSFTLDKKAVYEKYRRGEKVTYIVGINNESQNAYNAVTLTDNLGRFNAGTTEAPLNVTPLDYIDGSLSYWVNGVSQPVTASASTDSGALVISGIAVPAQSIVQIGYEVRANEFAPFGAESVITNSVEASGTGVSPGITAEETVSADSALDLEITKALSPLRVNENGQITYTFTFTNYSPSAATAADEPIITDTFSPYLNITSVNFTSGGASAEWSATTDYTYTADGTFTSVPGKITVPAATSVTNPETGAVTVIPGTSVLTVTGQLT